MSLCNNITRVQQAHLHFPKTFPFLFKLFPFHLSPCTLPLSPLLFSLFSSTFFLLYLFPCTSYPDVFFLFVFAPFLLLLFSNAFFPFYFSPFLPLSLLPLCFPFYFFSFLLFLSITFVPILLVLVRVLFLFPLLLLLPLLSSSPLPLFPFSSFSNFTLF